MTNGKTNEAGEKPLDPEMEAVRRKMVRTLAVSIGIMMIGLIAVLGAIVYKLQSHSTADAAADASSRDATVPADAPMTARTSLPSGFTVSHVGLSGGRILFYGTTADGAAHALVVDMASGRIVADLAVGK